MPETLPEAQAKPMAKAAGAEGYEPIQIDAGANKPKFQVLEGGMAHQPGGQSPLQVMASGASKGPKGGSLRPASPGSTGRSVSVSGGGGGKSVAPGKSSGSGLKSSAGSKAPAPVKATPAKSKAASSKTTPAKAKPAKAKPVKTKAKGTKTTPPKAKPAKAKPVKTKATGPKTTPTKAKPAKATPAKGSKKQQSAPKGSKKGGLTINPNWRPTQAQLNALLKMAKPPRGSALDKQWRFARYKANGGKKSFKSWLPGSYGGRGGGKGHQQIQQKLTDIKQGAPKGAKKEVTVGNRAADAYWPPQNGKPAVYHQIGGKNPKRLDPIARERSAINDLRKALGKQVDIWFWDKRNPAAPPLKNPDLQPNWH